MDTFGLLPKRNLGYPALGTYWPYLQTFTISWMKCSAVSKTYLLTLPVHIKVYCPQATSHRCSHKIKAAGWNLATPPVPLNNCNCLHLCLHLITTRCLSQIITFCFSLSFSLTWTVTHMPETDRSLPCPSVFFSLQHCPLLSSLYLDLSSLSFSLSVLMSLSLSHVPIPLQYCCVGSVQLADRHPVPQ